MKRLRELFILGFRECIECLSVAAGCLIPMIVLGAVVIYAAKLIFGF